MHDATPQSAGVIEKRNRLTGMQDRLERLLLWRVWERLLEIEFLDRSIALAGKAFVSFFPLVIVIAAFVPERMRSSIINALTTRMGVSGDELVVVRQAFASSDDIRDATGILGLVFAIFFVSAFTTALQRVYVRAWRRPHGAKGGAHWRGMTWLLVVLTSFLILGSLRTVLDGAVGIGLFVVVTVAVTSGLWWFTAWFLLLGQVRARVLVPTGIITGVTMTAYSASAVAWMPELVTKNAEQFGFFGIGLAVVTWFTGAALCILVGACAGPVFAEDVGSVGAFVRGGEASALTPGAAPSLPPPVRALTLRDAFQSTSDS